MKSKMKVCRILKSFRSWCSKVKLKVRSSKKKVSENSLSSLNHPSPTPTLEFTSSDRIFSDVAGDTDFTVIVDGEPFLLHKFPLVAQSGKIRKMVADAKDSNISELELLNLPGGAQTFELAAKYCYGMNFEITTSNVAHLRCAAEFLEMTEDYREENLIARTETYLNEVVVLSLEKSVQVLCACETLLPIAEELGILNRCVNAIAVNACKEQLVSGLSCLDRDSGPTELKGGCLEWLIEALLGLRIDFYHRVVCAMEITGVPSDSTIASLMHYAEVHLKDIGKQQISNPVRTNSGVMENGQRTIVETLVSLLPTEKSSSIPLSFLFGMLRMAIVVDATLACRLELETRISFRLEMVSLDDLLIPSVQAGDSLFDVDTVHQILVHFVQRLEEEDSDDCGCESEGLRSPSHGCVLKVGRLVDAYLAEIAPDPNLSLQKFVAMIEVLPDYARDIHDGLYRAVDIYLKAHPMVKGHGCKKLCKYIDFQKLSQEACNHAARNARLPVQIVVQALYSEPESSGDGFLSQKISNGIRSATMSPRDNYASLRRENRELKLHISRMRVRLSELEKEQMSMKEAMLDKSGIGQTFLTSLSRGIGRIGIFNSPGGRKNKKSGRKSRVSEAKTGRSQKYSVS